MSIGKTEDRIILNVGGTKYETFRTTLTAYPKTLLGVMFLQEMIQPTNGNEYFLDRDGQLFRYVLQYYRNNGKIYLPNSDQTVSREELLNELDFFQIQTDNLFNESTHASAQPLNPSHTFTRPIPITNASTKPLNSTSTRMSMMRPTQRVPLTNTSNQSLNPTKPVPSIPSLPNLIDVFDQVMNTMKRNYTSAIQIRFGNGYIVVEPSNSSHEELFRPFGEAGLEMIRQSGSIIQRNFCTKHFGITWNQSYLNNEVTVLLMNRGFH